MAARCFWDADTDSYAHDVFMNVSIDFYNGKYKAVVSCSTDKSSHWFCFFFFSLVDFFFLLGFWVFLEGIKTIETKCESCEAGVISKMIKLDHTVVYKSHLRYTI